MNTSEDFNRLYADVGRNIEQTLADIAGLHVDNEDAKKQLNAMTAQLQILQNTFNQKLSYLQEHAEWDKFTLAFFGETNAGKSTIIESLRIVFDETSRRQLLQNNQNDLQKAEQELCEHLTQLRDDLGRIYSDVVDKISAMSFSAIRLQQIITNESTLRLKMEEEANKAHQLLEQNESQSRLQILQQRTSTKSRITLLVTAFVGVVVGAGAVVLINLLTGH
ncbi:membrane protein [Serratia marcescens]|uniref:membrane protein n=1 Tax=Serratia TaxID=613 RepID=UPI000667C8D5|nr:membrane protein [Serratia marcescens]